MTQPFYTELVFDVENCGVYHFGMPTQLQKDFKKFGLTPTKAAKITGIAQPEIHRWVKGARRITKRGAVALAPLIQRTPESLLFSDRTVRIVGKVGAASELNYFAESSGFIGLARFPEFGTEDTVAVEIEGDSLGPGRNGWIAYYNQRRNPPSPLMIGQLCIVGLVDGGVYAKRLMRARMPDRYDLWPGSGSGDPIEDQEIEWAALIRATVRPEDAKIEETQEEPPAQKRPRKQSKPKSAPKRRR